MKKWLYLAIITAILLSAEYVLTDFVELHPSYNLMVVFFAAQAFVLFRLDHWAPKEWSVQMSLVKIVLRLISSMILILVLVYTQEDPFRMVIQFIAIYLVYMIFEIVIALTNLRRN